VHDLRSGHHGVPLPVKEALYRILDAIDVQTVAHTFNAIDNAEEAQRLAEREAFEPEVIVHHPV
jgi:hypothetical protein